MQGDAAQRDELRFTHIYINDSCFSAAGLAAIGVVLQRSPFFVLASHRKAEDWWASGLFKVQAVAKLGGMRTTGGESDTMFIFVNMEMVPS